jgi:uncharacterized protein (DUF983 family)
MIETTSIPAEVAPARELLPAMRRGAAACCPACGARTLYTSYLKVADACASCGEALHHHRADDAPPYFTIFIVGHIVLAGAMSLENAYEPSTLVHAAIWLPLTLALSLLLLPRIKGALVALQWALRMHGFGSDTDEPASH